MAGRDLTYTIGVDASDATTGLRRLESAVRSTMREVDDSMDDGATAGDKFAASIEQLGAKMKEDFNSAAIAAEELQRALRDAGSGLEVGDALTTLQRMGFSFGEVTADADKFAASLKQLDDVRITGVKDLGSVAPGLATKLDNVSKSADSSKSVLANMVGNSVQDLGQLSGIAGSAGVAIGQMGEYMADARAQGEGFGSILKNFGKLAGPMAALGIATLAVSQHMQGIKLNKEFNAKQVEDMVDAMRNAQTAASALQTTLEETGKLEFSVNKTGLIGLGQQVRDIIPDLEELGLSFTQFQEIAESGGGLEDLIDSMAAGIEISDDNVDALARVGEALEEHQDNLRTAKAVQEAYNRVHTVTAAAARDAAAAFRQAQDPAAAYAAEFERIAEAIATGAVPAAKDLETVTEGLGITMAEAFGIGQQIVDEHTAAVDANNEKMDEARKRQRDFADAVGLAEAGLAGATDEADALGVALERLNETKDLDFSRMALDTVDSFDAMKDAIAGTKDIAVDWATVDLTPDSVEELKGIPDELAAVTDGISGMRDSIQAELTAAFETGGTDAYTAKAEFFRSEVLGQFPAAFQAMGAEAGDAEAQAAALADELGLMPEDIQIMIQLTREEEARAALDAFASVISGMPQNVQVAINTALAEGDVETALGILNDQLINRGYEPITLPIDADPTLAEDTVEGIAGQELPPATIPLEADPTDAERGVDGFVTDTERQEPEVKVKSSVAGALLTMLIINAVAKAMAPTVVISANAKPALDTLNAVQQLRPKVPVEAYLADYPTASEIQRAIGRPRIPVDIVVGSSIRITGVRD